MNLGNQNRIFSSHIVTKICLCTKTIQIVNHNYWTYNAFFRPKFGPLLQVASEAIIESVSIPNAIYHNDLVKMQSCTFFVCQLTKFSLIYFEHKKKCAFKKWYTTTTKSAWLLRINNVYLPLPKKSLRGGLKNIYPTTLTHISRSTIYV